VEGDAKDTSKKSYITIKNLKRMSHMIVLPSIRQEVLEVDNKNANSPASPNHPMSKKFTSHIIGDDHFRLTDDIYQSKEDLKIEEESHATSHSEFR
jgi:hypothetical protein